jgi:hypothetical protein
MGNQPRCLFIYPNNIPISRSQILIQSYHSLVCLQQYTNDTVSALGQRPSHQQEGIYDAETQVLGITAIVFTNVIVLRHS